MEELLVIALLCVVQGILRRHDLAVGIFHCHAYDAEEAALLLAACYIRLPDYRIYKVFSYSGLNVRETDLFVIVYKPWRIDQEVQGIVSQHNAMNGTPDKLTVWLYYSKYNLDRGKDFNKVIFEYSKSQVTDPPEAW